MRIVKRYKAPWGTLLIVLSTLLTVLCSGLAFLIVKQGVSVVLGLCPLALVIGCVLFTIHGYSVTDDAILVHRLFWTTRLSLADLQSARFEPCVMRWSIRIFGNGGFFSFAGVYHSKSLGCYRAFVTDRRRTVVLRYPGRTVVVSPEPPQEFARELTLGRV
jgi:hypothetical protein